MSNPEGFLKVGNDVYICDTDNNRIVHYNIDGTLDMNWTVLPSASKPKDIIQRYETDDQGSPFKMFYVTCGDHKIRKIYFERDPNDNELWKKKNPSSLDVNYDVISGTGVAGLNNGTDTYSDNDLIVQKHIEAIYNNPSKLLLDTRSEYGNNNDLLIVCDISSSNDSIRKLTLGTAEKEVKTGVHFIVQSDGQLRKYIFNALPENIQFNMKSSVTEFRDDFSNPKKIILHGEGDDGELYITHDGGFSKIDMKGIVTDLWTGGNNPNGFLLEETNGVVTGAVIADTDNNRIVKLSINPTTGAVSGAGVGASGFEYATNENTEYGPTTYGSGAVISITFPSTSDETPTLDGLIGGSGYANGTTITLDPQYEAVSLGMSCDFNLTIANGEITDITFANYTAVSSTPANFNIVFYDDGTYNVNFFENGSGYPDDTTLTIDDEDIEGTITLTIDNGSITAINIENIVIYFDDPTKTLTLSNGLTLSENVSSDDNITLSNGAGLIINDPGTPGEAIVNPDDPATVQFPEVWNVNTNGEFLYNVEAPTDVVKDAKGNYYITSESLHTVTKIYSDTSRQPRKREIVCGIKGENGNINTRNIIYQVQDYWQHGEGENIVNIDENDEENNYLRLKHSVISTFDKPCSLIIDQYAYDVHNDRAYDGMNNLLVLDKNNNSIKKLFMRKRYYDTTGCFYVTDTEKNTIMKIDYEYDNTDNAIVEGIGFNIPIPFAGFGDRANNEFDTPKGICLYGDQKDPTDYGSDILVVDSENNVIKRIDSIYISVSEFSDGISPLSSDADDEGFKKPTDIIPFIPDQTGAPTFLISDTKNHVIKRIVVDTSVTCSIFVGRHGLPGYFDSGSTYEDGLNLIVRKVYIITIRMYNIMENIHIKVFMLLID